MPRHLLATAFAAALLAGAARAQDRTLVHVLAGDTHTTVGVEGGAVVFSEARSRSRKVPVAVPPAPLAEPDRVLWVVGRGRRTRIAYRGGAEVERKTFDSASGRPLPAGRHLGLPPAAARALGDPDAVGAPATPAPAPGGGDLFAFGDSAGAAEDPAPVSGDGFVGEAVSATDLFGEDLGGLVETEAERPRPLAFRGYVETLLMGGEDGPSPHVFDTGLGGNRALEVREMVLHLDASLGKDMAFFGQIRAIRFNRFDARVAMLRLGDPAGPHWDIGRTITPFGVFPARNLATDNPLYGYPLGYFYRTSLRKDSSPAGAAALAAARGTGGGGAGMALGGPGIYQTYILHRRPLGSKAKFVFGLQNGAQSANENVTSNDAFGGIARLSVTPHPAWTLGASGSVAPYINRGATGLAADEEPEDFDQTLIGVDVEFARDRWRLLTELLWNEWEVSRNVGVGGELEAFSWYAEAQYSMGPKWFLAARYSEMDFDEVSDGAGGRGPWDFDTDRLEVGVGFRPTVNFLAKLSGQANDTDTTVDPDDDALVLQLIGSF